MWKEPATDTGGNGHYPLHSHASQPPGLHPGDKPTAGSFSLDYSFLTCPVTLVGISRGIRAPSGSHPSKWPPGNHTVIGLLKNISMWFVTNGIQSWQQQRHRGLQLHQFPYLACFHLWSCVPIRDSHTASISPETGVPSLIICATLPI